MSPWMMPVRSASMSGADAVDEPSAVGQVDTAVAQPEVMHPGLEAPGGLRGEDREQRIVEAIDDGGEDVLSPLLGTDAARQVADGLVLIGVDSDRPELVALDG